MRSIGYDPHSINFKPLVRPPFTCGWVCLIICQLFDALKLENWYVEKLTDNSYCSAVPPLNSEEHDLKK